ncbi:hypothetical protein CWI84_04780 [Idiomarina tyrosinivorans]|uniref:Toxin co-regulated pilus biosynthesis protein Q C-terminal domain-containing protein n=1 Tax=Idiomarina tyrosinivorans TaxID=1445662 RepID=A0A432ZRD1_9GAMM|nr:hypothetical protein CWI84_04780 [Idiomarina tyrosinivorans]
MVSPKFALHKGPLQPQIERLLTAEFNVDTVDWQASPHHQWPTEFTVEAVSWRQVLGKILSAYKLQAVFYANRSAVIRYREQ